MSSLQARTFTRAAGTRAAGTAVNHAARLELLEQYLAHHEDIVRCAQASVDWLARHAGVKQSACLAVDAESNMLVGIAAHGIHRRRRRAVFVAAVRYLRSADRGAAIAAPRSSFKAHKPNGSAAQAAATPLGRGAVHGHPARHARQRRHGHRRRALRGCCCCAHHRSDVRHQLGRDASSDRRSTRSAAAAASRTKRAQAAARARAVLHDHQRRSPTRFMLTDTEGRLIVANARAEKLFAASEEESEGRRRAVELNNMLFSAALSRVGG